ncbi:sulfur carrier protein ThiS [Staphylococcus simulans]
MFKDDNEFDENDDQKNDEEVSEEEDLSEMVNMNIPKLPKFNMPELPSINVPEPPKINIPETPSINIPNVDIYVPNMEVYIPKISLPEYDFYIPEISLKEVHFSIPEIDIPEMKVPKMDFSGILGNMPTFDFKALNSVESVYLNNTDNINKIIKNLNEAIEKTNSIYSNESFTKSFNLGKQIESDFTNIQAVIDSFSFNTKEMSAFLESMNLPKEDWYERILEDDEVEVNSEQLDKELEDKKLVYSTLVYVAVAIIIYSIYLNLFDQTDLTVVEKLQYLIKEYGSDFGMILFGFAKSRLEDNDSKDDD